MDIYVVNLNGAVDIIEEYHSAIWNVQFFGMNDFELTVDGSSKNFRLLTNDTMLVRAEDITPTGFNNVMIIKSKTYDFDVDRGWMITVRGSGIKSILERRIVWEQTNLTGNLEACIRQVINANIINSGSRAISNFILGEKAGITDALDAQLLGENIAEWLSTTCQSYGIGWDVSIDNGKYVFALKKGTDRTFDQETNIPVVFSQEYDNLASTHYSEDKGDYKNAALIGGEGEGVEKRTATIGDATELNRYETYIDGSGVSSNGEIITEETYYSMLQDYGRDELAKTAITKSIGGTLIPNGMYDLNQDYFLGDLVQIVNNGLIAKSRITEIIYSEDENGSLLVPTFSDWEG